MGGFGMIYLTRFQGSNMTTSTSSTNMWPREKVRLQISAGLVGLGLQLGGVKPWNRWPFALANQSLHTPGRVSTLGYGDVHWAPWCRWRPKNWGWKLRKAKKLASVAHSKTCLQCLEKNPSGKNDSGWLLNELNCWVSRILSMETDSLTISHCETSTICVGWSSNFRQIFRTYAVNGPLKHLENRPGASKNASLFQHKGSCHPT